jgi:phosphoribosylaminoimidazolecarboxamide formyltransferase/IMP cyclohydrolase
MSVADKTGLPEFAARLVGMGVAVLSTGGTARLLRERGISVQDVSEYTGFPEIMGGRIKTQHPKVHGGLLARRDDADDMRQMVEHGIQAIDMAVVNLHPFADAIHGHQMETMTAIENIDIGGSSLIRAGAKNYTHVAVVTNPADYGAVTDELEANDGVLSEQTHFRLALEAFRHTARYDTAVAYYLASMKPFTERNPHHLGLNFLLKQEFASGECPHRSAALYTAEGPETGCAGAVEHVAGPSLDFGSVVDLDIGVELVRELPVPAVSVVRNANPTGGAVAGTLRRAYERARAALCVPLEGCTVVANTSLDKETAAAIASEASECQVGPPCSLAAPDLDDGVRQILGSVAYLRLLTFGNLALGTTGQDIGLLRHITGGLLRQEPDAGGFDRDALRVVAGGPVDEDQMQDLHLAWICCKHARSSAAVLANQQAVVGVGAGQETIADAMREALGKTGAAAAGAALASDQIITRDDVLEAAARAGVTALIQPGGSGRDGELARSARRLGLTMIMTGRSYPRL